MMIVWGEEWNGEGKGQVIVVMMRRALAPVQASFYLLGNDE